MSDALDCLNRVLADRYRVERELGAGGMATVYLAEDLKHGRRWLTVRSNSPSPRGTYPRPHPSSKVSRIA